MGVFKTGQKPGPGRPKGMQNKLTVSAKTALMEAFNERGGVKALVDWADKEPTAFYQLWGRLVPTEVTGAEGGPLVIQVVKFGDNPAPE